MAKPWERNWGAQPASVDTGDNSSKKPWERNWGAQPATSTPVPAADATFMDSVKQGFDSTKAAEMLELNRSYRESLPDIEKKAASASNPVSKWFWANEVSTRKKGIDETSRWLAENELRQSVAPKNKNFEGFTQTDSFSDAAVALAKHPVDVVKHGFGGSAVPMGLMLGNAYLGGRVGGVAGTSGKTAGMAAAGGASSFDMEYKSGVMEGLQSAGVDIGDPKALEAALDNRDLMDKIHIQAQQKAAVIGTLDGFSMGIAGKALASTPVKNAVAQGVAQVGLGAGGEVGGALYSGQKVKPSEVILEGLLEVPGSVAETAIATGKLPWQRNFNKKAANGDEELNPFDEFDEEPAPDNQRETTKPEKPTHSLNMGEVVDRMVSAESSGNANAQNPYSSAGGLGQFIDSTWLSMIKQHRPDVAKGKNDADLLRLKFDPALSREMTVRYAEDNARSLAANGFDVTPTTVYLAHHFGDAGAKKLLQADVNASALSVVGGQVVAQNPYMKNKSVGDVLRIIAKKMGDDGAHGVTVGDASSINAAPDATDTTTSSEVVTQPQEPQSLEEKWEDYDIPFPEHKGIPSRRKPEEMTERFRPLNPNDRIILPDEEKSTSQNALESPNNDVPMQSVKLGEETTESQPVQDLPKPAAIPPQNPSVSAGDLVKSSGFVPTHEFPDGTPVMPHPEDEGVWIDQEGIEYEGPAALPPVQPASAVLPASESAAATSLQGAVDPANQSVGQSVSPTPVAQAAEPQPQSLAVTGDNPLTALPPTSPQVPQTKIAGNAVLPTESSLPNHESATGVGASGNVAGLQADRAIAEGVIKNHTKGFYKHRARLADMGSIGGGSAADWVDSVYHQGYTHITGNAQRGYRLARQDGSYFPLDAPVARQASRYLRAKNAVAEAKNIIARIDEQLDSERNHLSSKQVGDALDSVFASGKKLAVLTGDGVASEMLAGEGVLMGKHLGLLLKSTAGIKRIVLDGVPPEKLATNKRLRKLVENGVQIVITSPLPPNEAQAAFSKLC